MDAKINFHKLSGLKQDNFFYRSVGQKSDMNITGQPQ